MPNSGRRKSTWHRQHRFTKVKSYMTNLIYFYHKVICLCAKDIVCLGFNKATNSVPHSIFLDKLSKCGMNVFRECRVMTWLKSRAQRVVLNGAASVCQLTTSSGLQGSVLGSVLFNILINNISVYLLTIQMQELNTPLTGLLMIPSWELLLTLLWHRISCRGI